MKAMLFEDPFWIYGALIIAEAVLAARWWRTRERRHALWMLLPLGIGVGVFALATLVETDREKIQRSTQEIVVHVQARKTDAIEALLDEDFRGTFQGQAMDRKEAMDRLRQVLSQGSVGAVEIKKNEVEVRGPEAHQKLNTVIELRGGMGQGRLPVNWQIHWIRVGGQWKIHEVAEPLIGLAP